MKKLFRTEQGDTVDLVDYTKRLLAERKDITQIAVGTDSQNKRYNTCYCTTVAFQYGTRGSHCIYMKENIKKIREKFPRLWGEVTRSIEIAQLLEANNIKVNFVELDFNKKELSGSNPMVASSKGYVIGMGFDCKVKPDDGLSAVKYSDSICRR